MTDLEESNPIKVKRIRIKQEPLLHYYSNDEQIIEIGIDEVDRYLAEYIQQLLFYLKMIVLIILK